MADRSLARKVLETEAAAILALVDRLDERFDCAVLLLRQCKGRVILTGMGKSGIICRKIAATLTSTGTPALFLHPAEAIHGDLGMIQSDDIVLALSYSGETDELLQLLETIRRLGAKLIVLTGDAASTLAQAADVALDCSVTEEACPMNLVPTASTTAALAIGDALAMTLLVEKGFRQEDFANLHPGGKLGKRRGGRAGDDEESCSESANRFKQTQNLVGFTAVRQRDDDIGALNDAEVAMNRFGGMQEEGRRPRARERRRDLPADDAGFAHAGENHAAAAIAQQLHRPIEFAVEPIDERQDRRRLRFQYFAREGVISHSR